MADVVISDFLLVRNQLRPLKLHESVLENLDRADQDGVASELPRFADAFQCMPHMNDVRD